ncbi:MAG: ferredoxin FdxA [Hyphomicrobiales bacterium]
MTYVVNDKCIKCKYMDCIDVCPVECFREGENMVVINQEECIDCAACEPFCPVLAIVNDQDGDARKWRELNEHYGKIWPSIVRKGTPPSDAAEWENVPDKFEKHFSPAPAQSGTGASFT